jgi:hypothetical protein
VFHYFTIKFLFSFFAYFRFKFFASLHLSNFRFEAKRNSSLFFRFKFFASLRFSNFASKRNKAKRNSSLFFRFFRFFHFFSLNFRFASIFSLNFRLFYLPFCFRFLVFRIEVNNVKSGFFFASKRNEIFASISNFASKAKVRAHPSLIVSPMPLEATNIQLKEEKHICGPCINFFQSESSTPRTIVV